VNPHVSIIIPCHNAGRWLEASLASAISQTYPSVETLLIDDRSTDGSRHIAESFPSVKVLRSSGPGAAAARNTGLAEAEGKWMQFLDADDILARDKLAIQMEALGKCPPNCVAAGAWGRFYGDPLNADFTTQPLAASLPPEAWLRMTLRDHVMMHPAAWLVPRQLIERAGRWDERLSLNDDGEFFARVVSEANHILYTPRARSFYRSGNSTTLSQRTSKGAWTSAYRALDGICDSLLSLRDSSPNRDACSRAFRRLEIEAHPFDREMSYQAARRAEELGEAKPQVLGGNLTQLVARFVGPHRARSLQSIAYRFGYQRLRHRMRKR